MSGGNPNTIKGIVLDVVPAHGYFDAPSYLLLKKPAVIEQFIDKAEPFVIVSEAHSMAFELSDDVVEWGDWTGDGTWENETEVFNVTHQEIHIRVEYRTPELRLRYFVLGIIEDRQGYHECITTVYPETTTRSPMLSLKRVNGDET